MNAQLDPTIFDSLNARQLTPAQIAQSFIPPEGFFDLIKRNNNLLIGPRGSGKTTLLKMLQLPALSTWKHDRSLEVSNAIDYISVFIPTDRAWEKQWALIDQLNINSSINKQLKKAIFTTHTLRQMIDSFKYCTSEDLKTNASLAKFYISLSKDQEVALVKNLAHVLSLKVEIPSLDYVILQLKMRLSDIGVFINKNLYRIESVSITELEKFIYVEFMNAITILIEILNTAMKRADQKWALLFDELEIAPKDIRNELFDNLRSTDDQRVFFKLSISPYAEDLDLSKTTGSYAGHDYVPINLTYSRKENARPFCEALFKQMCRFYKLEDLTPSQVFGISEFDKGNEDKSREKSSYGKDSILYQRFKRLAKKDPSFVDYLTKKNVDIENMDKLTENERASKIRKITNVVCLREIFLNDVGNIRTIKKTKIFTGVKTLFDITEGNPRLFLGLIGPLLKRFVRTKRQISSIEQAKIINIAIDRFMALLRTIPTTEQTVSKKPIGLIEILDLIGKSFQSKILKEDFFPEPITSFIIDEQVPEEIKKLLGMAVNAGAIIYVHESEETPLLDSMENKEFRLSHLLAPYYRLPMIINKSQKLSRILNIETQIIEPLKKGQITFDFDKSGEQ